MRIREEDWRPVGVESLENLAEDVVRSNDNKLVIAGPGAGKTELLAQRAHFLLSTRRCPHPKRILAISFKRDAAKNLQDRVRLRSGDDADRFDSMTLDSFAKQIVDRFYLALPEEWRPRANYLVRTSSVSVDEARAWLLAGLVPQDFAAPNYRTMSRAGLIAEMDLFEHSVPLPYDGANAFVQDWGRRRWRELLARPVNEPSLSFAMLSRLAAYLFRVNPRIKIMLQTTYSHVFLDEFQDTTPSQWDVVTSAFGDSNSQMTAVGDSKQRIMVWAGADPLIFQKFTTAFHPGEPVRLVRNYRSVERLVQIQHAIAQIVEEGTARPVTATDNEAEGTCEIWAFQSQEDEAAQVADFIESQLNNGYEPRDICVLARANVGTITARLENALRAKGISLRDESLLQDLRAEPITSIVVNSIILGTQRRNAAAWISLTNALSAVTGLGGEGVELERLAISHKQTVEALFLIGEDISGWPERIVALVGEDRYRAYFGQYMNGTYLERVIRELGEALAVSYANAGNMETLIADFVGENIVPAMSIHKSKGLEFKTVIFLGLEDGQWWNFGEQPDEEKRAFFVAFSRAIETVLFTYSQVRDNRFRNNDRTSQRSISGLLDTLRQAGVEEVRK